jgi:ABC-2 type transport system ATP-binding protein
MIKVSELTKYFGVTCAVDRVSFSIARGEVVGLLGPNGSGKTTIMRILTGFFPPTSGQAWVGGWEVQENSLAVRRRLGYVPENVVLYPDLPVRRFLGFAADVKGVEPQWQRARVEEVMATCGLDDVAARLIRKLSRGYRQRVAIAQALLNEPDVLILDEPTVGLDPRQAIEIRTLIRSLGGTRTVVLSTHILPEVSALCGRVIILDRGKVVAEDTATALARRLEGAARTLVRVQGPADSVAAALGDMRGVERVEPVRSGTPDAAGGGAAFVVFSGNGETMRREIAALIVQHGWGLLEVRPLEPSLEELFVRLVDGERGRSRDA